ncbi:MAG: TRAP transporter large permease subunit [Deltaproteobacteria bacterium]|nr:TRAP transporter large permease subunit [Deltaproteobacteria bacterium]
MAFEKIITLVVFITCYGLALSRKVKIAYASIVAATVLLVSGLMQPSEALFKAVKWDVLGIYWGFMMVSFVFMKSRMPDLIANRIITTVRVEKYVIFTLCCLTAFLSAFMENVGVVLMMAPVAIAVSLRMQSDLFPYLISIAISSNVVTTLTMVADPPSIILALATGMKPLDFYLFQGRIGLGTITLIGVLVALGTLLFQFRRMQNPVAVQAESIATTKGPSVLFVLGVAALAVGPEFGLRPGTVGLIAGLIALYMGRADLKEMIWEFDWNSFFFIIGIFIVIYNLNASGLLKDFAELAIQSGINNPTVILAFMIWISVALSSFMDNVPYTILMIPVCQNLASSLGINAWPFLYGMLIGTGIGGNITPVGATANVFACGILEKHGEKVQLGRYMNLSIPFSLAAVAAAHLLLQLVWM